MGLTSDAGRYLFSGSGVRELFLIKRRWEDQSLGVAVSMWLPLEFQETQHSVPKMCHWYYSLCNSRFQTSVLIGGIPRVLIYSITALVPPTLSLSLCLTDAVITYSHQIPPVLHQNLTRLCGGGSHIINVTGLIVRRRVVSLAALVLVCDHRVSR